MLNSLKARQTKTHLDSATTKQGIQYYNGSVDGFHEWEFRTMAKYHATKAEERFQLGSKVLEGLVDQAYQVAYEFGLENLRLETGVELLVKKMKENHPQTNRKERAQGQARSHLTKVWELS